MKAHYLTFIFFVFPHVNGNLLGKKEKLWEIDVCAFGWNAVKALIFFWGLSSFGRKLKAFWKKLVLRTCRHEKFETKEWLMWGKM